MRLAVLLASGLAAGSASAQSAEDPHLEIRSGFPVTVIEGDQHSTYATIRWVVTPAPAGEVRFSVASEDGWPLTAVAGVDYVPLPKTEIVVPAGTTSGEFTIEILGDTAVEGEERFDLRFSDFVAEGDAARGQDSGADAVAQLPVRAQRPATVMPSIRTVGASQLPRMSRSSAGRRRASMSRRLPAMVTSLTGHFTSPPSIQKPAAPRL